MNERALVVDSDAFVGAEVTKMVMGVRPWLVLLQGEVLAFLLYPCFTYSLLHLCIWSTHSCLPPEAAPEHRIILIVEDVDGEAMAGASEDLRAEFVVLG